MPRRTFVVKAASTLTAVPSSGGQSWQEVAASIRERLTTLERELERQRDAVHAYRAEAQAVRFLGEKVADLGNDVRQMAGRMEVLARDALHRPSASALSVLAQYLSFGVAIVALVVAVTR